MKTHKLLRGRPAVVLLVEDGDSDVELTKLAFEHGEFKVDLHVVRDGEHCMMYLRKQAHYSTCPTPDLILLDLHMPRMDGMEVLKAINDDSELRHLPTVVLTTSTNEHEILQAYERQCSGYLLKPLLFADFAKAVRRLEDYWFSLVRLP